MNLPEVPGLHGNRPLHGTQASAAASMKPQPIKRLPYWDTPAWWHAWGTRSRFTKPTYGIFDRVGGIDRFFTSAVATEWWAFAGICAFFLLLQYHFFFEWPSKHKYHGAALVIWLLLAAVVNLLVWWRFGLADATTWFSGYLLELVFSLENIFVFHIVVRSFRVPRKHAQKALMVVVVAQIMFEMALFMGLAWNIRSKALPYILGAWLIYVGYQAGSEEAHEDFDFKETWVYKWCTWLLGKRLHTNYTSDDVVLFGFGKQGFYVTLLCIATVCLVAVDVLLEVDVVLTKIEELGNPYLAFTSSATAAFAVPELFFICRDLFSRYYLLKFGISFVLVFFGVQLLLQEVVSIPILAQVMTTFAVMALCVALSMVLPAKPSDLDADDEKDFPAPTSDENQDGH